MQVRTVLPFLSIYFHTHSSPLSAYVYAWVNPSLFREMSDDRVLTKQPRLHHQHQSILSPDNAIRGFQLIRLIHKVHHYPATSSSPSPTGVGGRCQTQQCCSAYFPSLASFRRHHGVLPNTFEKTQALNTRTPV